MASNKEYLAREKARNSQAMQDYQEYQHQSKIQETREIREEREQRRRENPERYKLYAKRAAEKRKIKYAKYLAKLELIELYFEHSSMLQRYCLSCAKRKRVTEYLPNPSNEWESYCSECIRDMRKFNRELNKMQDIHCNDDIELPLVKEKRKRGRPRIILTAEQALVKLNQDREKARLGMQEHRERLKLQASQANPPPAKTTNS